MRQIFLALAGDPVRDTRQQLEQIVVAVRDADQWYPEAARCLEAWTLLSEKCDTPEALEREIERLAAAFDPAPIGSTYASTLWILVLCVYGRFARAFEHSEQVRDTLWRVSPFVHVVDHQFYRGLAAAVLAGSARGRARRRYLRALRESLRHVQQRAASGPDFVHMAMFLQAELARLRRDLTRARSGYEQVAQRAKLQGFPHHVALAHERRASLLASARRESEAAEALRDAIAAYRDWGVQPKVRALSEERAGLRTLV
jgi:hypothetical protein